MTSHWLRSHAEFTSRIIFDQHAYKRMNVMSIKVLNWLLLVGGESQKIVRAQAHVKIIMWVSVHWRFYLPIQISTHQMLCVKPICIRCHCQNVIKFLQNSIKKPISKHFEMDWVILNTAHMIRMAAAIAVKETAVDRFKLFINMQQLRKSLPSSHSGVLVAALCRASTPEYHIIWPGSNRTFGPTILSHRLSRIYPDLWQLLPIFTIFLRNKYLS